MKKRIILWIALLPGVAAQAQTLHRTECPLGYDQYIGRVWRENLSYAAEKLNVRIADAEVKAAGVFNDPQFGVEYGNNADRRMQMGQSVSAELSKTFSPGKRAARIDLARSEQELSGALLEDYFRNLRAEATLAYLDAVKQAELFRVKQDAYENIRKLAEGDSVKYTLGKITRVDDIQSGLEAGMMYNELLQARTDLHNAFFALNLQTATFDRDTLYVPSGSLHMPERTFDPDRLVQSALDNRADLAAALKDTEVARRALMVARRERNMDFDVSLGVNHNTEVRNEIAPAPRFNGVTVGLSVPLKFSNLNKGTVQAAKYRIQQAEARYRQAELEVQTEVLQNLRQYLSLAEQVRRYETGLLEKAKSVIDGKIYSYDRGETPLLEVLNAQRTYDDLRTAYIETLYDHAAALVELERSAGIWDVVVE